MFYGQLPGPDLGESDVIIEKPYGFPIFQRVFEQRSEGKLARGFPDVYGWRQCQVWMLVLRV